MTNAEFYKEEILEEHNDFCQEFIVPKVLAAVKRKCASDYSKKDDDYEIVRCNRCGFIQAAWLMEEHKEPEVDWSTVPIDTPILVKDGEEDEWLKRYFAGANEDGAAIAWADGRTSFTATDIYDWEQAKLWEGSEEQAEEERQKREAANE